MVPEMSGEGTGYTLSGDDIKTQHFVCDGGTENHKHSYRNSDGTPEVTPGG